MVDNQYRASLPCLAASMLCNPVFFNPGKMCIFTDYLFKKAGVASVY